MRRRMKKGLGGGALDDLTGVHDRDRIADLRDHGNIVGDQHDCQIKFLLQVPQYFQYLVLHDDVKRGDRLIGDQKAGIAAPTPWR